MGFPVEIQDTHNQDQSKQNLRRDSSLFQEPMCKPFGNSLHPEQKTWNEELKVPFEDRRDPELERDYQAANRGKYFFAIFKELLES
ncbi:hypothetical protein [Calidifontibacillus erzurumensis]